MKFKHSFKNDLAIYNELKSYAYSAFKKGKIEKTLNFCYYQIFWLLFGLT